jgi:cell division protein FtsL
MMEMQLVIRDLNGKVHRLQAENLELKTQVEDNVKGTKLIDNKATAIAKKLDALDSTTKKEFKKLQDTKSHVK